MTIHIPRLTGLNMWTLPTSLLNLQTAIGGVSLGIVQELRFGNVNTEAINRPTDPKAQRELKWLVRCRDTVTLKRFQFTVPCANMARLNPNQRDFALLTQTQIVFFLQFLGEVLLSPWGNAAVVESMELVGRAI